jgi:2-dehydro-3-deoxygluconokinase
VPGVVTLGETMGLLSATEPGPLRHADVLRLGVAGSEFNVAVGLRRLGAPAAWIGRVGDDELGRLVVRELRAEDVTARVVVDHEHPTGLMLKERRSAHGGRVTYYRRGSAGAHLEPGDLDLDLIAVAEVLHVTGITPALSHSARAAVDSAVDTARRAGVLVSVDVNHRDALWERAEAAAVLTELCGRADLVLASADEARMLVGDESPERLAALGPSQAVVKLGARGAVAWVDGEHHQVKALPVREADPVGAGDAFVAGYLAALLEGAGVAARLELARTAGAFAVTVAGDWEGLPTRDELAMLADEEGTVTR